MPQTKKKTKMSNEQHSDSEHYYAPKGKTAENRQVLSLISYNIDRTFEVHTLLIIFLFKKRIFIQAFLKVVHVRNTIFRRLCSKTW